jgi:hypothetical protein
MKISITILVATGTASADPAPRCTKVPKAIATQQDGPGGVVVDATHAYWTNQNGGQVMSVALDGGAPKVLADKQHPFGIAVDTKFVYWANNTSRKTGSVMRVPKTGGATTTVAAAQGTPYGPAFAAGGLYWTTAEDGGIVKAALDGAGRTVAAASEGAPVSIATNATGVYWLRTHRAPVVAPDPFDRNPSKRPDRRPQPPPPPTFDVRAMALAGGAPKTLATDRGNAEHVVVDARRVYWTNPTRGVVMAAPIGGGGAVELVKGERYPLALAIDAVNIYWIDHGRPDPDSKPSTVLLRKAPLAGGTAITLANIDGSVAIAVDATCVYWTEARGTTGTVMTVAK